MYYYEDAMLCITQTYNGTLGDTCQLIVFVKARISVVKSEDNCCSSKNQLIPQSVKRSYRIIVWLWLHSTMDLSEVLCIPAAILL